MLGLPVADPQFWIVTLVTVAVVSLALRRLLRRPSVPAEPQCAGCPAARAAASSDPRGARPAGLALLAAALLPTALLATSAAQPTDELAEVEAVTRSGQALGGSLEVVVEGLDADRAKALADRLVAEIVDMERRLSVSDPGEGEELGELARLNRAPIGERVVLSPPVWKGLSDAVRCAHETDGAGDPTTGALVAAWDLRGAGRVPTDEELTAARGTVGFAQLGLDRPGRTAWRLAALQLDPALFARGVALTAALDLAAAEAPEAEVRLELGGQLAWTGRRSPLAVGLADPRDPQRQVLEVALDLPRGSVATSGEQDGRYEVDGRRFGRWLDPRTGHPAPDFGTATSIGPSATLADCRSTALFVLGPAAARLKLAASPSQGDNILLVVEGDRLRALVPARMRDRVRALVPELSIETVSRAR